VIRAACLNLLCGPFLFGTILQNGSSIGLPGEWVKSHPPKCGIHCSHPLNRLAKKASPFYVMGGTRHHIAPLTLDRISEHGCRPNGPQHDSLLDCGRPYLPLPGVIHYDIYDSSYLLNTRSSWQNDTDTIDQHCVLWDIKLIQGPFEPYNSRELEKYTKL
jgi:hypothetical protein